VAEPPPVRRKDGRKLEGTLLFDQHNTKPTLRNHHNVLPRACRPFNRDTNPLSSPPPRSKPAPTRSRPKYKQRAKSRIEREKDTQQALTPPLHSSAPNYSSAISRPLLPPSPSTATTKLRLTLLEPPELSQPIFARVNTQRGASWASMPYLLPRGLR
jgi:hypothetical protein